MKKKYGYKQRLINLLKIVKKFIILYYFRIYLDELKIIIINKTNIRL